MELEKVMFIALKKMISFLLKYLIKFLLLKYLTTISLNGRICPVLSVAVSALG